MNTPKLYWVAGETSKIVQTIRDENDRWIADCAPGYGPIFTASPDLLAALSTMVSDGECYCADNVAAKGPCGWCQARTALAKATGQNQ